MKEVALRPASPVEEPSGFSSEQLDLIKSTVAKGATDDELKLFLYRCKNMGLDPLKPGQVHFIKYGSNPGTVVIGIDGFRSRASKTGKHVGTKRGISLDDKGRCIGAWCEVYRSDWQHPAREEVPLAEYNSQKGNWHRMPQTMIKKVAEVAALRMAFPDELGGVYAEEELAQQHTEARESKARDLQAKIAEPSEPPKFESAEYFLPDEVEMPGPGDYVLRIGKDLKGKRLEDVGTKRLDNLVSWYDAEIKNGNGKKMHPEVTEDLREVKAYLNYLRRGEENQA